MARPVTNTEPGVPHPCLFSGMPELPQGGSGIFVSQEVCQGPVRDPVSRQDSEEGKLRSPGSEPGGVSPGGRGGCHPRRKKPFFSRIKTGKGAEPCQGCHDWIGSISGILNVNMNIIRDGTPCSRLIHAVHTSMVNQMRKVHSRESGFIWNTDCSMGAWKVDSLLSVLLTNTTSHP